MKFFAYDSKLSQILINLCRSCYLNMLWLVCCLPVFTAGAATAALYSVTLKIAKGEEPPLTRQFFTGFRQNFRQATVLWLIMLGIGVLLAADGYIVYHLYRTAVGALGVFWTLLLALLIVSAILYTIVLIYLFPLTASVSNTNWAMLKNSFLIGIHYLFCTILVFAVHFAMFYVVTAVFTPMALLGEGLCALVSAYLLTPVIRACSYDPAETECAE